MKTKVMHANTWKEVCILFFNILDLLQNIPYRNIGTGNPWAGQSNVKL